MPHRLIIGCGYLGRRAAERWLADGDRVSAITRSRERAEEFRSTAIEPVVGDVTDLESLSELPEADTLLYAVGLDRSAGKSQREVYVDGLRNVLAKMSERCRRLIYISSSSVFGQSDGEWVDENSPTEPTRASGQICLDAERLIEEFADAIPRRTILRLSGIYGPDRLLRRLNQLKDGEPIAGNPDAWLNLIHVDDAVTVVRAVASEEDPGPLYLVSDDRPVRRGEYYAKLAELAGVPAPTFDDQASARHSSGAGKRSRNDRVKRELDVRLSFPTFEEGLPDALARSASFPDQSE